MTDTEQGLQQLYRARRTPALVDVPALGFLMIDGHGDPNGSQRYQAAIQALYAVSYALKFTVKRAGGPNHRIAPLEGPWWVEDMTRFTMQDKSAWDRTMMIRQPTEVTPQLAEQTARQAAENKQLPAARKLRLARYAEGRAAQVLHLGPLSRRGTDDRAAARLRRRAGLREARQAP